MRVYLAGPMRGYKDFNFPAFFAAADYLRSFGYEVFSPAERDIEKGFDNVCENGDIEQDMEAKGYSLREAMAMDMEWICHYAEGMFMLPGWEDSNGAKAERHLALALGLPVQEFWKFHEDNPER